MGWLRGSTGNLGGGMVRVVRVVRVVREGRRANEGRMEKGGVRRGRWIGW